MQSEGEIRERMTRLYMALQEVGDELKTSHDLDLQDAIAQIVDARVLAARVQELTRVLKGEDVDRKVLPTRTMAESVRSADVSGFITPRVGRNPLMDVLPFPAED